MSAACGAGLALFLLLGMQTCADPIRVPSPPAVCPLISLKDIAFSPQNDVCSAFGTEFSHAHGVIEGDEVTLQKVLGIINKNERNYVALLFYSSWCPFSGLFKPSFSVLAKVFPSIPHFAIEESAVRPSILSKYGVHGFPTLILLNSTARIQYQGSRTLDSLISFYNEFTGMKLSADRASIGKIGCLGYAEKHENNPETCPFPWAKSPENLFQQETYLTLATLFVILRLLHFFFPTLRRCVQFAWRRYPSNANVNSLWELNRAMQLLSFLKHPWKKSNLQEGAKNAKFWASKSLATVSFGDASSSCETQQVG